MFKMNTWSAVFLVALTTLVASVTEARAEGAGGAACQAVVSELRAGRQLSEETYRKLGFNV